MAKTLSVTSTGKIYQLNVKTGKSSLIANLPAEGFTDIDIGPNGDVYALNNLGLYTVDLAMGTATKIISLIGGWNGMEIGKDGKAYITEYLRPSIAVYDLETGLRDKTLTYDTSTSDGDIEIVGKFAYIATNNEMIVKYDLKAEEEVGSVSHSISSLYGLQYDKGMIAFSGVSAYAINLNTGASNKLVDFKIDGIIYGTAGIGTYTQKGNGRGNDLEGSYFNDRLIGKGGRDDLSGEQGNDVLKGGAGRDNMFGGTGNDRLIGGTGNDKSTGGKGADTFVFASGFGKDTVRDFQNDVDTLAFNKKLWSGELSTADIVNDFAKLVNGNAEFTFDGGERLVVKSVSDLAILVDDISII